VFWKIFELLIRVLYFRRLAAAKRIGEAGRLLNDGRAEEALALLERAGARLHQTLLPVYAFTRGKILDALGRTAEAEEAFRLVVLADPANARADLELAIIAGRRRDFQQCREWLDRMDAKKDEQLAVQAAGIRDLMERCASGDRERELAGRARTMAEAPLGTGGEAAGWPPDLAIIDGWIERDPDAARGRFDEIAIMVGQAAVERGGRWSVSLALDECVVVYPDGTAMNPFAAVAARLDGGAALAPQGPAMIPANDA